MLIVVHKSDHASDKFFVAPVIPCIWKSSVCEKFCLASRCMYRSSATLVASMVSFCPLYDRMSLSPTRSASIPNCCSDLSRLSDAFVNICDTSVKLLPVPTAIAANDFIVCSDGLRPTLLSVTADCAISSKGCGSLRDNAFKSLNNALASSSEDVIPLRLDTLLS